MNACTVSKEFSTMLLWLKHNLKKIVLVSFLLSTIQLSGQLTGYDWSSSGSITTIPDSLLSQDAVMVNYSLKVEYDNASFYRTEIKRIRILSSIARDYISNFSTRINHGSETVIILDARTIKPNGQIICLNQKDILVINHDPDNDGYVETIEYKFPVPMAETGDEIEIVVRKKMDYLIFRRFFGSDYDDPFERHKGLYYASDEKSLNSVFLHSKLPCLHAEFILQTTPDFQISYKCYNGFPKPEIVNDSTRIRLTSVMNGLRAVNDRSTSCMPCELPYLSYYAIPVHHIRILFSQPRSWDQVYKRCVTYFDPDQALYWNKTNYLFNYYEKTIKPLKDSGALYQFRTLYEYVRDHIRIKPLSASEEDFNVGYYLSAGYMDQKNLMKLYRKMFEYLDIPYYYCFVRSRNKGPFDMEFFREDEISDVFMAFRDEKGKYHIVQPHGYSGNTYDIDEVSARYRGTEAVLSGMEDTLKLKTMSIPEHTFQDNYRMTMGKAVISPFDTLIHFAGKTTLSGDYSTSTRSVWITLDSMSRKSVLKSFTSDMQKEEMDVDSLHLDSRSHEYPYLFKVSFKSLFANKSMKIEDSLYNLPIKGWIKNPAFGIPDYTRILGIYLPFAYSNTFKLMLAFDHPVEILNADKFNIQETNDLASYSASLTRLDEKNFLLTSSYTIKKSVITKERFSELIAVNKAYVALDELSLLYKIVKE